MAKLPFLEVVSAALFMSVVLLQATSSIAQSSTGRSCDGITCPSDRYCEMSNYDQPVCVCDEACTREYDPICGSDGITHGNQCTFNAAACETFNSIKMVHLGECKTGQKDPSCDGITCPSNRFCKMNKFNQPVCVCAEVCTLEYAPICGSDGVTYGNQCDFDGAACETFNSITMVHRGQC